MACLVLCVAVAPLGACAKGTSYETPFGGGGFFGGGSSGGIDAGMDTAFQPTFGPLVTQAVPPPPISGGTLHVMSDGHTVIAADPDRDAVYVVDVSTYTLLSTVALQPGDEPGRVAEDGAGRVHVALRGGGALVTIDPTTGTILARRPVCPAPRGVAWDSTKDLVYVACATGEFVTLPSAGGAATSSVYVERDLRDVLVLGGAITVSSFRDAALLQLGSDGSVQQRTTFPAQGVFEPHVAWRTVADAAGDIVVVHQAQSTESIATQEPGAYGSGGASSVVETAVDTVWHDGSTGPTVVLPQMVLPVDAAVSPDGTELLVAAAGNSFSTLLSPLGLYSFGEGAGVGPLNLGTPMGQVVAVAFDGSGEALAQTREPAALWVLEPGTGMATPITLSSVSRDDSGHDLFHTQAGGLVACASCHPEGGDDGHIWTFDLDSRRTPSLRGTVGGTAPYHWPGDMPTFPALAENVYTVRMSGAALSSDQIDVLQGWVEGIPAPPVPSWVDAAAAQRGQALFTSDSTGCTACHNGPKFTNNATVDVGTGGAFQVPPLVGVGWRTPLLHDGCATTLADRFGACATPQHGMTSQLTADNVSDLVAYLETL